MTLISIVAQSFIIKPADYYSLPSISFILFTTYCNRKFSRCLITLAAYSSRI